MKTLIATLFLLFSSTSFAEDYTDYCVETTVRLSVEVLHKAGTSEEAVVQEEFRVRAERKGFDLVIVRDFVAVMYKHLREDTKVEYEDIGPMAGECERLIEKAAQGAGLSA